MFILSLTVAGETSTADSSGAATGEDFNCCSGMMSCEDLLCLGLLLGTEGESHDFGTAAGCTDSGDGGTALDD